MQSPFDWRRWGEAWWDLRQLREEQTRKLQFSSFPMSIEEMIEAELFQSIWWPSRSATLWCATVVFPLPSSFLYSGRKEMEEGLWNCKILEGRYLQQFHQLLALIFPLHTFRIAAVWDCWRKRLCSPFRDFLISLEFLKHCCLRQLFAHPSIQVLLLHQKISSFHWHCCAIS